MARFGLGKPPPTDVLEAVVVPASRSLIGVGHDAVSDVINGVVQVRSPGRAPASHEDTSPIPQLNVSA
jgi:hypothetical protein